MDNTRPLLQIGLVILATTYYCSFKRESHDHDDENIESDVFLAWQAIKPPDTPFARVAFGLNTNLDLIVNGSELISTLGLVASKNPTDRLVLESFSDLNDAFTYFLKKGAAAERYYKQKFSYDQVISTASTLQHTEWNIGGNAALMAKTMIALFPVRKVMLAGPIGPKLRSLLDPELHIPATSSVADDEVHLIMEFHKNERWGPYVSPVSSRFITSHDEQNGQLTMLDEYFTAIMMWKPDLVVITGFHNLDGAAESLWTDKIAQAVNKLSYFPRSLMIHLEIASMANKKLVASIIKNVFPLVDSVGCNEQELAYLSYAAGGPHTEMHKNGVPTQPDIQQVTEIIRWILDSYPTRLSRLHFHSLTYHLIATRKGPWSNTDSAVLAGTRIAGQQACGSLNLTSDIVELRFPSKIRIADDKVLDFNPKQPLIHWEDSGIEFYLSPVLVCKKPWKTVGLGDAISATALAFSEH